MTVVVRQSCARAQTLIRSILGAAGLKLGAGMLQVTSVGITSHTAEVKASDPGGTSHSVTFTNKYPEYALIKKAITDSLQLPEGMYELHLVLTPNCAATLETKQYAQFIEPDVDGGA